MEACGNRYLQEHIPVPYLDARLVLIVLWRYEIAKVAQLYILPCLSFVLPPLFLFLHLYPVTQIMLPLSISSAEMQESHTKLWTWKARQKNNNKYNRSPRVSECVFPRASESSPSTCARLYIKDVIWMCCWDGFHALLFAFTCVFPHVAEDMKALMCVRVGKHFLACSQTDIC